MPSKILKYLFLGGKQHAKDRQSLRDLKITHILNCTPPRRSFQTFSTLRLTSLSPQRGSRGRMSKFL
jgi:hypothetical protein